MDYRLVGNIEGHDIPRRKADVVVTDGFTGNVILKFADHPFEFLDLVKQVIAR